jgi:DNA (cytosine-5)-methyltransferase 1
MKSINKSKFRVIELFAGVGGFRVGFNGVNKISTNGLASEKKVWDFVWANQWEPSSKSQDAFKVYETRFGSSKNHINKDIFTIDKISIPDHEIMVGGFPCQDYSVARSLSGEKGIEGKKGVLWWEIFKTLETKETPYLLLENVDRLLKSPSKLRGRDFGIMLASLNKLGYNVEWRVLNAAEFGFPQRRKRVFIFGKKRNLNSSKIESKITPKEIVLTKGLFSKSFRTLLIKKENEIELPSEDLVFITNNFKFEFYNSGYMSNGKIYTAEVIPEKLKVVTLSSILDNVSKKDDFIVTNNLNQWKYLKGAKKIERVSISGYIYTFSEGAIAFPDFLDRPSRTMLTSEGTKNRSSHILYDESIKKYRTLTPIEAERLNGFPDNWTSILTNRKRFFMMGNALVCGLVKEISKTIYSIINSDLE